MTPLSSSDSSVLSEFLLSLSKCAAAAALTSSRSSVLSLSLSYLVITFVVCPLALATSATCAQHSSSAHTAVATSRLLLMVLGSLKSEGNPHSAKYLQRRGGAQEAVIHSRAVGDAIGGDSGGVNAGGIAQDAPGRILAVEEIVDGGE